MHYPEKSPEDFIVVRITETQDENVHFDRHDKLLSLYISSKAWGLVYQNYLGLMPLFR